MTGVPAGRSLLSLLRREKTKTAGEETLAFTGNLGLLRKFRLAQEILGFFELFASVLTSVDQMTTLQRFCQMVEMIFLGSIHSDRFRFSGHHHD